MSRTRRSINWSQIEQQDRLSPRITALLGGVMVGAGFVLTLLTSGYWGWIAGFDIVEGKPNWIERSVGTYHRVRPSKSSAIPKPNPDSFQRKQLQK